MKWQHAVFVLVLVLVAFSNCNLLGGGGGGEGGGAGGGGGASFTFSKGFAFVRKDDTKVYLADEADLQTSATLTSATGASNPSFSADTKSVVFVQKTASDTTEITTVATSGGSPTTLVRSDALKKNFRQPVFSPDGTRVAFSYDENSSSSVGLVNADGSNFQKLIGGGALAYALPSFSADGKAVFAAAGNTGLQLTQIERVDVATGQATNVTNTLGNEALGIANRLVVSPDGTKAAFDGRVASGVTRIFVIDLSTKVVTKVNDYMGEPNTNDTYPTWYSNSLVAFGSDSGGNDNVYRVGLDASGRKLLMPKAIQPWYGPVAP